VADASVRAAHDQRFVSRIAPDRRRSLGFAARQALPDGALYRRRALRRIKPFGGRFLTEIRLRQRFCVQELARRQEFGDFCPFRPQFGLS
jgi:hypothetical protein